MSLVTLGTFVTLGTVMESLALALPLIVAHVLYGLPRAAKDAGTRITLHNGDDFDAATDEAPRIERIATMRAVTGSGSTLLTAVNGEDGGVSIDVTSVETPGWLVVETRPAFIELAGDRFDAYLRHEGLASVLDARRDAGTSEMPGREIYTKFAKTALGRGTGSDSAAIVGSRRENTLDAAERRGGTIALLTEPVGLPIEIVPLAPLVTVGDRLTLCALVDGRPGADLQMRVHHKPTHDAAPREAACLRTDAAGLAIITIDAPGLWRLHTISMTRGALSAPATAAAPPAAHARTFAIDELAEADWRSHWASLTFQL